MNNKTYTKIRKRKINQQAKENAYDARILSRKMKEAHPELSYTQTLLSAYIFSGKGNLTISKIKLI